MRSRPPDNGTAGHPPAGGAMEYAGNNQHDEVRWQSGGDGASQQQNEDNDQDLPLAHPVPQGPKEGGEDGCRQEVCR
ncbi:hypothetical protein [Pseudarthrobacter sp. PS3-L1]|uniref:hypothetical protein n=1 Tax=Pseudarthrobacter sp. PS3-L1 TaxID=3046207 RepID=UPI0024BBBC69|nr:hypothetical protein [Pseudarthrobacter sp. PS3-L1]MDJ0322080.1 hypothetical protein [Pseudarthrobacter sp. PS3-L1]